MINYEYVLGLKRHYREEIDDDEMLGYDDDDFVGVDDDADFGLERSFGTGVRKNGSEYEYPIVNDTLYWDEDDEDLLRDRYDTGTYSVSDAENEYLDMLDSDASIRDFKKKGWDYSDVKDDIKRAKTGELDLYTNEQRNTLSGDEREASSLGFSNSKLKLGNRDTRDYYGDASGPEIVD